jgi:cytochrome c oxidase assembly protein subunit 11
MYKYLKKHPILTILWSIVIAMVGLTYASVPIYRIFCQVTGYGGTTQDTKNFINNEIPKNSKKITINFQGDIADGLAWKFKPIQKNMQILIGEAALAFYQASNLTDKSIIGVSTYNVTPAKAGIYFNKIQCFCFEEQMLQANETIDMPVFFYLDPDWIKDPNMDEIDSITLSYTFFKSSEFRSENIK